MQQELGKLRGPSAGPQPSGTQGVKTSESMTIVGRSWEALADEAGEAAGPAAPGLRSPGTSAAQIALIAGTVVVDALAPLLQEHASRTAGFESSSMVLAETMSYYLGGLALGGVWGGVGGIRRCLRPARYVAFLPASAAFSTSNFLTYIAVRGLGASQFYLLAQLRVAILAVFLRVWSGVRQPVFAWLALVQLAVGMVVLVWHKANVGIACGVASAMGELTAALGSNATHGDVAEGGVALAAQAAAEAAPAAAERAEFVKGVVALVGVVLSSAFGFIYLEWQLKANSQDPLFIQLHQMNSFGAAASLVIRMAQNAESYGSEEVSQHLAAVITANASLAASPGGNATLDTGALAAGRAAAAAGLHEAAETPDAALAVRWYLQIAALWSCIVARGILAGSVLKQLDSIAKGLIDVTAIVLCTTIQFGMEGIASAEGTVLGIEALLLLSIVNYVVARASSPQPPQALKAGDRPLKMELREKISARVPSKGL